MIRYRCWKCGQKIRSRQEFAGKMARCPNCSYLDRVPTVAPPQEPVIQAAARPGSPSHPPQLHAHEHEDERESILEEPPLPPPTEDGVMDSIFDVPPLEPSPPEHRWIRYHCPHCDQRLRAPEANAGKNGRCPQCRKSVPVPRQSSPILAPPGTDAGRKRLIPVEENTPLPPRTAADEGEHESIFENPPPTTPQSQWIRYQCPYCHLKLRAPDTAAGRSGRCPGCMKSVPVPKPTSPTSPAKAGKRDPDSIPTEQVPPLPSDQSEEHQSPTTIGPMPTSSNERTEVRCPHCHHRWRGSDPGKPCRCPRCHHQFSPTKSSSPAGGPQSAASLVPPTYELIGELGKGAFGVVYMVRHVQLNRVVALKVMRPDVDPELMPRFRLEAQAVARMQHPNIVQIFEVGEHQGRFFCAFEYVDGGSLQEMLHGRPLPSRQAAQLVQELALAMHYAHQQGVVHRDLKPANILFSRKRATTAPADPNANVSVMLMAGTLKITDFGLAKRLDDDSSQTRAGAVIGTPSYMSPEQAEGKEVGPVADVYSLGAVLYEMLTGKPPFVGKNVYDTLHRVCYHEPVLPRQLDRKIPRDLETICLKCLEKNPARRYASALDLAADLGRFRAGDSIQARPASIVARSVKAVRRRPTAFIATVLLLVAAIGVTWGVWAVKKMTRSEQARVELEAEKKQKEDAAKEATELKIDYYSAFVNNRGMPRGIRQITPEQAKKRHYSFKFHRRGGLVEKVECVNAKDQLSTSHSASTLLSEAGPNRGRECSWEFSYRDDRQVASETARDRNGEIVWKFAHSAEKAGEEKTTGHYQDEKGFPRPRSGAGATYVELTWDDKGFLRGERYFDSARKPSPDSNRVYGHQLTADENGLHTRVVNVDADGNPCPNKEGVVTATVEFDNWGNRIKGVYYGADNQRCLTREGYASYEASYDDVGNLVSIAYQGTDGKPRLNKEGFARVTLGYDGNANLHRVAYFDVDGKACTNLLYGSASWTAAYDDQGNRTEVVSYGPNGKPRPDKDGYVRWTAKYDKRGNVEEVRYTDADGKPRRGRDGTYGYLCVYDARGNRTEKKHFGPKDEPCLNSQGYARSLSKYDESGRLVEESFFGTDGKPCPDRDGDARWTVKYDERGNRIEEAFYGLDGELRLRPEGYARWTARYDDYGNRTEQLYFDADGRECMLLIDDPVLGGGGNYHGLTARYDAQGNRVEESYFDVNRVACLHRNGYARWEAQYDDRGNRVSQVFFDLDGKPCLNTNDYAVVLTNYDERGKQIREAFYGPDGRLCLHKAGYARTESKYDDRGNRIEVIFLGTDGRRTWTRDRYAGWTAKYDDRGNVEETRYLGPDGRPCLSRQGYASWKGKYDERDNRIEVTYHDVSGGLCATTDGYACSKATFDDRGNRTEQKYFDVNDNPCLHVDGHHGFSAKHDERGNRTEQVYFDVEGKPVKGKDGYASLTARYDVFGNRTEGAYFGPKGESVLSKDGYARWAAKYNQRGALEEVRTYGTDDKLCLTRSGFARGVCAYDDAGLRIKVEYFGTDGKTPILTKEGYATFTAKYDDRRRRVEEVYLGTDGREIPSKEGYSRRQIRYNAKNKLEVDTKSGFDGRDGYATRVIKYDEAGQISEVAYFAADGKTPVLSREGIARFTRKHDERGNRTEEIYFDREGRVTARSSTGYSAWRRSFSLKNELLKDEERGFDVNKTGYANRVLTYENGRLKEVAFYGRDGKLARSTEKGYAKATTKYDKRGKRVEEVYFDAQGNRTRSTAGYARLRATYDDFGNRKMEAYLDVDGKLVLNSSGYARIVAKYDERNNKIEEAYHDARGNLTLSQSGYARMTAEYDERGNPTDVSYFGPDDKPIATVEGIARFTCRYDDNGRLERRNNYGVDGKPVASQRLGYATYKVKYDEFGNRIQEEYFDAEDKPTPNQLGYSKLVRSYGPNDEPREQTTTGHDADKQGYDRRVIKYDVNGRVSEVAYYDDKGKPAISKQDGIHGFTAKYDDRKNRVEESYFGADGKPCPSKASHAGWVAKYDERGNNTERLYLGLDGKPCQTTSGYARWVMRYDERNRRVEQAFFDAEGKPCLHKDGYARWAAKYDERGNRLGVSYFNLEDRLSVNTAEGHARWEGRYDGLNRLVEEFHFGANDNKVIAKAGYSSVKWVYDNQYRKIDAQYFDAKGNPIKATVVVATVQARSQGQRLKLQAGDVLLNYDGKAIVNQHALDAWRRGEKVTDQPRQMVVERKGVKALVAVSPGDLGLTLRDRLPGAKGP